MKKKQKTKINSFIIIFILAALVGARYLYIKTAKESNFYGAIKTKSVDILAPKSQKIVKVYVIEKDFVKKGDLLAELDKSAIDGKIKQVKTKITYEKEMANLLKFKEERAFQEYINVKKDEAIELKDITVKLKTLEENQLLYKIQKAKIETFEAKLELLRSESQKSYIYSPISGQVTHLFANNGDLFFSKQKLFSINDVNDNWIELKVRKKNLSKYKLKDSFNIVIDNFSDIKFNGKIFDINETKSSENAVLKISINQLKNSPDEKTAKLASNMKANLYHERH
ncbi:MAG: hypothetical protein KR126chlam6_00253 [Candidatus Anoxychlamydiales bacterium]|nr:hypothetical protein [Candidatus Anoxychlamydiales bacterium]